MILGRPVAPVVSLVVIILSHLFLRFLLTQYIILPVDYNNLKEINQRAFLKILCPFAKVHDIIVLFTGCIYKGLFNGL